MGIHLGRDYVEDHPPVFGVVRQICEVTRDELVDVVEGILRLRIPEELLLHLSRENGQRWRTKIRVNNEKGSDQTRLGNATADGNDQLLVFYWGGILDHAFSHAVILFS